METMRRAFRALSVLALVGGIDLAITAWVLATSEGMEFEPLQVLTMALCVFFSVLLGVLGLVFAGTPRKLTRLYLPTMLAIWANAGNVLLLALNGEGVASVVINAAIVVAYAYVANQLKKTSQG